MLKETKKVNHYFQKRLCFIGFNIIISLFALFVCSFNSSYATYLDERLGAPLRRALSRLSSGFDFSLAERLVALSPILIFILFVLAFFRASSRRRAAVFFLSLLSIVSLLFSLYTFSYGIAYRKEPFYREMEILKTDVTEEKLSSAALAVILGIRDAESATGSDAPSLTLSELETELCESYERCFGKEMPLPRAKLSQNGLMPRLGLSGLYFPLFAEISINSEMPSYNIPVTLAHELGHSLGIAREGDASFFSFLLCINSDEPYVRYCGYLAAYEHLSSALWQISPEAYFKVASELPQSAKLDILSDREYRKNYEDTGAVKIFDSVRDAHLAVSGSGECSYSFVTELIVAYYNR